jgi:hypothetical protein
LKVLGTSMRRHLQVHTHPDTQHDMLKQDCDTYCTAQRLCM